MSGIHQMLLGGGAAAGSSVPQLLWDSTRVLAGEPVFSNGDRTGTSPAGLNRNLASTRKIPPTGKYYLEFSFTAPTAGDISIGLSPALVSNASGNPLGATTRNYLAFRGWYWDGTAYVQPRPSMAAGQRGMMAVNTGAGLIWFGVDNVWNSGGNPAAGTGVHLSFPAGAMYVIGYLTTLAGSNLSLLAGQSDWLYTPPAGFVAVPFSGVTASGNYSALSNVAGAGAANIRFEPDGTAFRNINGSNTAQTNWFTPTTAGAGAAYWVRYTWLSGSHATVGTEGTWQQLNAACSIGLASTTSTVEGHWRAEIASSASGTPIVGTYTVDCYIEHGS